jgi:hypothetical protein
MLRVLILVAGIAVVFAVTLVVGGSVLGAWEAPKPAAAPSPDAAGPGSLVKAKTPSSPRPRSRRPSRPATHPRAPKPKARSRPSWVTRLNALCRSAEAETQALPRPSTPAEAKQYLRAVAKLSARWNGLAAKALSLAARTDSRSVQRLRELFGQERRLIASATAAVFANDLARLELLAPELIANGREQSRLLVGLGAEDCTLPDNPEF